MANIGQSQDGLTIEEPQKERKPSKIPIIAIAVAIVVAVGLAIALGVVVSKQQEPQPASSAGNVKGTTVVNPPPAATTASASDPTTPSAEPEVCMTSGCVQAAARLMNSMDLKVDPCVDFYQYSCGNWIKRNVIPESENGFDTFLELLKDGEIKLKSLFEDPAANDDADALKELRKIYQACLDEDVIEDLGVKPLIDELTMLKGWPMIDPSWQENSFNLTEIFLEMAKIASQNLMGIYVTTDKRNSSNNILTISESSLSLPSREYYLNEKYKDSVAAYKKYIIDIATFLNASGNIEQDAQDIIEYETYLANISMPLGDKRDAVLTYNKMTIAELYTNISDKFDWLPFINGLFSETDYTFTDSSELIVTSPKFLLNIVEKLQTTSNRTLANYYLWRFASARASTLSKDIQDIRQDYSKVVRGVTVQPPRWQTCVRVANRAMSMASGRMFVENYFKEDSKASALEMIAGIRESFNELLAEVPWMNNKTRKVAEEKAQGIVEKIGYPEWILNNTRLNQKYEGLIGKINSQRYYKNSNKIAHDQELSNMQEIKIPVDKDEWLMGPAVVNAYYSPTMNVIGFPAGILQPPFWQTDRPVSMNYGAIGAVIGHEITHGFDDNGRKYNKDGDLVEWWDKEVVDKFNEAKQCIVDQYNGYVVPQLNRTMNGKNTQGENMADNGGIKQSYRAFQKLQEKEGPGRLLPGLTQFSPSQLFFIGFGQVWCGMQRDQGLKIAIESGVHSPGMFRIIGTVSNSKEFSEAFKCPAGSPMNPTTKCSVW